MDGALERIESMGFAMRDNIEGLIVIISTVLTNWHKYLSGLQQFNEACGGGARIKRLRDEIVLYEH